VNDQNERVEKLTNGAWIATKVFGAALLALLVGAFVWIVMTGL